MLLAILVAGGFLRFYEMDQRGPSFYDEGIYTLEGQWISSAASSLKQAFQRKVEELRSRQNLYTFEEEAKKIAEGIEGRPPVWGRPGFSLMIGICMAWIGPKVYAANLVSALLGTLSILAVFLLARSMFPGRVALLAALLLALSCYHYVYSVTGLADVSAVFFTLVSFLFYYQGRKEEGFDAHLGWMALTGLFSGLSFTVHDRLLYAFFVIMLCEAIQFFTVKGGRRTALKRGLVLGCTFMIPLFLFELPYYLAMVFMRHFNHALPFRTYFEELFTHHMFNFLDAFAFTMVDLSSVPEAQEAGSRLYNFLTYPYLFLLLDGPVFVVLLLAGLVSAIRARTRADTLLLLWFSIPFLLFSMGLSASVRCGLVFLPAAVILAARSIVVLSEGVKRLPGIRKIPGQALTVILLLAIIVSNAAVSKDIRKLRCSYEGPATFLEERGSKHVSLQYTVSQAYLGTDFVKEPPYTREQFEEYYREGYRYFLVDFRTWLLQNRPGFEEQNDFIEEVEENLSPVFAHVHPCYSAACYLFEINVFFKATLRLVREVHDTGMDEIRIYDLKPLFEPEAEEK